MKESELVSILIPVYNRVNIVGETIQSALNQTYKNIEIVICDNCSTDGTWELLQQYTKEDNRIHIFRNEENIGPVRNWEKCLSHANGIYSSFLWSDDIISESFIKHTMELFDDDTAFVMSGVQILKDGVILSNTKYQKRKQYSSREYLYNKLLYGDLGFPMSPACCLFRLKDLKNALIINIPNKLGLDFSKYGAGNDLLFFLINASRYTKIKTTGTIESFFRDHPDSFSSQIEFADYYNQAKFYFIENYMPGLIKKFKTRIILENIISNRKSIFKLKISEINLSFLLRLFLRRIIYI
jgi:glycosyltransferase involved in cell wall biosynthesis